MIVRLLGQLRERRGDGLLLLAFEHLVLEVLGALRVELTERRVALADRGVEARRHAGEVANRHHLVERQLGLRRDLLVGGLAVEPSCQLGRDAVDRALALRDVGGDPHRATAVVEPALIDCLIHSTA